MGTIDIDGGGSSAIRQLMDADISPGESLSYQTAKDFWTMHPLGKKMADLPVEMAMSKGRKISMDRIDEEELVTAFEEERAALGIDRLIAQTAIVARVYGSGVLMMGVMQERKSVSWFRSTTSLVPLEVNEPIDLNKLPGMQIYFSVLDPLNTAGSLVLDQNPLSPDFMKPNRVTVTGRTIATNRRVVLFNEDPVYLAYTNSSFGFNGRSVYQRALYPLITYLETLETDRWITRKAGVLIERIEQAGSFTNKVMEESAAQKRGMTKVAKTGNVISTGMNDTIESLNLQNIDGAAGYARDNTIGNIASSASMPALLLRENTFAQGFGEGTEDSKAVADFVGRVQTWMQPLYDYTDHVCQRRAWSPEFFSSMQEKYPETYAGYTYQTALAEWMRDFTADWNPLIREPESEKVKVDRVKFEAVLAAAGVLLSKVDPENQATVLEWVQSALNGVKHLIPEELDMDIDGLRAWLIAHPTEGDEGNGEHEDRISGIGRPLDL